MAYIDTLIEQGYVPKGVEAKTIINPGEQATWQQTDRLNNVIHALHKINQQQQAAAEKRQEELKKQADYYKTLRIAGYPPDKAHEAASKMQYPQEAGGLTTEEQSVSRAKIGTIRERILKKVADEEDLFPGEQKVYDEIIKRSPNKSPKKQIESVDNYGFKKGELKEFKGKGKFEYIGNNQWKKVK